MLQSFDGGGDAAEKLGTGSGAKAGADDLFLNTSEAAKLVRMSPSSLERMRSKGNGPKYCKVGSGRTRRGRVVYRRSDVVAWLTERTFSGTSDYRR